MQLWGLDAEEESVHCPRHCGGVHGCGVLAFLAWYSAKVHHSCAQIGRTMALTGDPERISRRPPNCTITWPYMFSWSVRACTPDEVGRCWSCSCSLIYTQMQTIRYNDKADENHKVRNVVLHISHAFCHTLLWRFGYFIDHHLLWRHFPCLNRSLK